ncbi:MAG TPA: preprotein translocase subunit YajC [Holosporales bacterium]|nr:preprotein translocase subunit YajC [Holosporales bacterium]
MFFITAAYADGAASAASPFMQFVPLILIGVVMYFLMFRPEQKKKKEHEKKIAALTPGVQIITNGGIVGTISKIENDMFLLEIAKDVHIRIVKSAVTRFVETPEKKVMQQTAKNDVVKKTKARTPKKQA